MKTDQIVREINAKLLHCLDTSRDVVYQCVRMPYTLARAIYVQIPEDDTYASQMVVKYIETRDAAQVYDLLITQEPQQLLKMIMCNYRDLFSFTCEVPVLGEVDLFARMRESFGIEISDEIIREVAKTYAEILVLGGKYKKRLDKASAQTHTCPDA